MGAASTFASFASLSHSDTRQPIMNAAKERSAKLHPKMMKASQHTRVGAFVF